MQSVQSSALQDNKTDITFPDSDGQPMANNTLHAEYIATTKYGIESVFQDRDDVFVAMDLFWYPVKDRPKTVLAPDVMVVLGRPKGERKSYKQWKEDNIGPQVVFEFVSESNTTSEMTHKAAFFERYGVQEYYLYDLERREVSGLIRYQEQDDVLEMIADMEGWISPRLGIRFDISSGALQLYKPTGEPFLRYSELEYLLEQEKQRANAQEQRANAQEQRANALAAKLRELGINPDAL
jgi:Uma2 family endonuclease